MSVVKCDIAVLRSDLWCFNDLKQHAHFEKKHLLFCVQVADRELGEAKLELTKTRGELERQDLEVAQLRGEVSRLAQDNKDLSNNLTAQTNDLSQCEALVDKLQEDKRKLATRVNRLINTGILVIWQRRWNSSLNGWENIKHGSAGRMIMLDFRYYHIITSNGCKEMYR